MPFSFHELGVPLYDFCMFVLFVTVVLALRCCISIYGMALKLLIRFQKHRWYRLCIRPVFVKYITVFFAKLGLCALPSFLLGMFKDLPWACES
jgi:hypothetical protein